MGSSPIPGTSPSVSFQFRREQDRAQRMNHSEQLKMIQELEYHMRTMTRDDRETFEMFLKRNRDDEDLDRLSQQKLAELHEKYVPKKTRRDVEEMWKKMTKGGKE